MSTVATVGSDEIQGVLKLGVPEPTSCDVLPLQKVKVPVRVGSAFTATVSWLEIAHCPAVGVKVYVVVALLFKAGDHVPVRPSKEVEGKGANELPTQTGATGANVGVLLGRMLIVRLAVVAH